MKQLIKNTTFVSSTEFALIFVSIVRAKYLAIHIGPEGYGVYALLDSFFNMALVFSGTWLGTGIIKYTSEYNKINDIKSVRKIYNFSIFSTLVIASFFTMLFLLLAVPINNIFIGQDIKYIHYSLFAASFVGMSLKYIFTSIMQGLMQIKKIVYIRIIITVSELFLIITLVYFFDLTGYFLSIFVSSIFTMIIFWKEVRKVILGKFSIPKLQDKVSKELINFGGVALFLALINLGSVYLQRLIILKFMSISFVGLFGAANSLMGNLKIINKGSAFCYLPKMSEKLDINERNKEVNDYLRFTLLTGIPISIIAILFSKDIIQLLYSQSFSGLADVFYIFVIAYLVNSIEIGFQLIVVGMAFLKIHTIVVIITHIMWVAMPFFLIKSLGLSAIGISLILSSICAILINFSYLNLKEKLGIKITRRVNILFLIAIATLCISIILKNSTYVSKVVFICISGIILFLNLQKEERSYILKLFREKLYLVKDIK